MKFSTRKPYAKKKSEGDFFMGNTENITTQGMIIKLPQLKGKNKLKIYRIKSIYIEEME